MISDPSLDRFADFFRDLAIAWRTLSAYPAGHPNVVAGLAAAVASSDALLAEAGSCELVATRDALLRGEQRFDAIAPARIAELLRRRGAAAVRLEPGLTGAEIERFLRSLALDPRRARAAGSLAAELQAAGLEHLAVTDLDFSAVVLVEGELQAAEDEGPIWERVVRRLVESGALASDRLASWIAGGGSTAGLVRSLLGGGGALDGGRRREVVEAAVRAAAEGFLELPGEPEPGGLVALAEVLTTEERDLLAREVARASGSRAGGERALAAFFAAFPEEEGNRLRRGLASAPAPAATPAAKPPDRVDRLRRAFGALDIDALENEGRGADAGAILLELAAPGSEPATADVALVEELQATAVSRTTGPLLVELAERAETSLAARATILHRVEAVFRALVETGRIAQAQELVERVQRRAGATDEVSAAFRRSGERLASRESVAVLARALPNLSESAIEQARGLVERLGPTATRHLLGALAESDDRAQRHRLLELLGGLGPLVVRDATHLLGDSRWYVVRNVLLLLRRVGDPGSLAAVRRCADHPDLRVRLEAIRNLFAFDQELPRELLKGALTARDPRLAAEAVDLAAETRMAEAAEPLADLLAASDLFGRRRAVRLKAIRALAAIGDPSVLPRLARFAARFTLLPVALEERVAFFRSLGAYPAAERGPWIERARRSPVREIREAAAAIAAAPAGERPAGGGA